MARAHAVLNNPPAASHRMLDTHPQSGKMIVAILLVVFLLSLFVISRPGASLIGKVLSPSLSPYGANSPPPSLNEVEACNAAVACAHQNRLGNRCFNSPANTFVLSGGRPPVSLSNGGKPSPCTRVSLPECPALDFYNCHIPFAESGIQ